jgi:hypothetical protein
MIDRLLITLRALASPAGSPGNARALALDFDDGYFLLAQCQQLELSTAQRDAVADVDRLLERARSAAPEVTSPEWNAVRASARTALRYLGYSEDT